MSIAREEKEKVVGELREAFKANKNFYLVDFVNLSVSQSVELRKQIRENSHVFTVIKNRLALKALDTKFPEELRQQFKGPTAIAYSSENAIGLARLLKNFQDQYKVLSVKAGFVEGQFIPGERFNEIATLTSREELIAKIGYLMATPLIRLLRTWQAPLNTIGSMLSQLKNKK